MRLIARTPIKYLDGRRERIIAPGKSVPAALLITDFEGDDQDGIAAIQAHELVRIGAVELIEEDDQLFHAEDPGPGLSDLSVAELVGLAGDEQIEIPASAKSKAAIVALIEAGRAARAAAAGGQG